MIIGSARLSNPLKRRMVSYSMVLPPSAPEPLERVTGVILDNIRSFILIVL
jgi:hypothetical protein